MLFNSFHFVIFFPIITTLYFSIGYKYRWFLLLAASCYFYMAFIPAYILILGVVIVVDYFVGRGLARVDGPTKKILLGASLLSNIGFLFFFKYFNFMDSSISRLAAFLHWNYSSHLLAIALPIGLSFHTFQSMAYIIEVYRGRQKPERHFGIYALYILFYPQLVAGPIERPYNLLPQFREKHDFDYDRVTSGLKLMTWGFFKKLFIADRLAIYVNEVYNVPSEYRGIPLLLAVYAFAFQIFCDFSGYTDIARGAAQVMGFRLMENFKRPYESQSISEFWRRWHISLSSWFRDYLYIPLGGNRVGVWRWQFNLFLTFLASGLWHGAKWSFVAWGALHGFYMLGSIWSQPYRIKLANFFRLDSRPLLAKCVRVFITFHLVTFAWIFFKAPYISHARLILRNLFHVSLSPSGLAELGAQVHRILSSIGLLPIEMAAGSILLMEFVHWVQRHHGSMRNWIAAKPLAFRWAVYYATAVGFIFFSQLPASREFIYFQF